VEAANVTYGRQLFVPQVISLLYEPIDFGLQVGQRFQIHFVIGLNCKQAGRPAPSLMNPTGHRSLRPNEIY
jgi:hypothetical protein